MSKRDQCQFHVLASIEYKGFGWMLVLDIVVVKLGEKRKLCCPGASLLVAK